MAEKSDGSKGGIFERYLNTATKKIGLVTALVAAVITLVTTLQKGWTTLDTFRDTDAHFEFVLDASTYMSAPAETPRGGESPGPSKWTEAVTGITSTLEVLKGKTTKVAVRRFGGDCGSERAASKRLADFGRDNSVKVLDALGKTRPCGEPDLVTGLSGAVDDLREAGRRAGDSVYVRVVTAGKFTNSEAMALDIVKDELRTLGVKPKFRFIGVGVADADMDQLNQVAASYGGVAIPVDNASDFRKAANPEESEQALLARLLLKRRAKQLYSKQRDAEAIQEFQKLAEAGDTDGWLYMGYIYYDPASQLRSVDQSKNYFRKAAEAGNSEAKFNLAMIDFEQGNDADGMTLLQQAADAGNALAREELNRRVANK